MQYIVKKTVVDAVQYNDNIQAAIDFAGNMILATQEEIPQYFIRTGNGIKPIQPGQWVVKDDEGRFNIMNDADFTAMYEARNV